MSEATNTLSTSGTSGASNSQGDSPVMAKFREWARLCHRSNEPATSDDETDRRVQLCLIAERDLRTTAPICARDRAAKVIAALCALDLSMMISTMVHSDPDDCDEWSVCIASDVFSQYPELAAICMGPQLR